MGLQRQLRKTIVANALVSIVLIALIVSGIMAFFLMSYQSAVLQRIQDFIGSHNIDTDEFKEAIRISFGDLVQDNPQAPLFPVLCAVTIGVVLVVSALFSHIMSKRILVPLRQLEEAAMHVADGNLDYCIRYTSDNEFESVKDAFNEMQDKLKLTILENIQQVESKKELIAGISHDLRTPLTSIKGYVHGLQDGVASTPEKLYHYLDTISAKTNEMEVMIDRLILFSKLDTGNEPLHMVSIDPVEYLEGYRETVAQDMAQRGLTMTYEKPEHQPVTLFVDCDQMSRVFANFLENSAKYKVKETANVVISSYIGEDGYVIEFADDGPGIPEEMLEKVFDSFHRIDPSRTSTVKGSGLGLAIADRIVTAHGGTVVAKNSDGLTMVVTLPLEQNRSEER